MSDEENLTGLIGFIALVIFAAATIVYLSGKSMNQHHEREMKLIELECGRPVYE